MYRLVVERLALMQLGRLSRGKVEPVIGSMSPDVHHYYPGTTPSGASAPTASSSSGGGVGEPPDPGPLGRYGARPRQEADHQGRPAYPYQEVGD